VGLVLTTATWLAKMTTIQKKTFAASAQFFRFRFFILISLFIGGCAVGPDFKRPVAPSANGYASTRLVQEPTASAPVLDGESQQFNPAADIPFDWWTLFQSPQINSLIQRAFKANSSIEAAQAALHQAQENVVAQQGFFYPTVAASYSPSRNKLAGNNGGSSPGAQGDGHLIQTSSNPVGPAYYNFHVAQLTVGYAPDVFGLNRRQVESAQAQVAAQKLQLEATYITLASNVVAAAVQEASIRAQLAAMEKIVAINQENLDILRKQFNLGYVSSLEVAAQESSLAEFEQSLAPLQKQLEQTRDLIRALVDNSPNEDVEEKFELSSLHLPQELPISLPSRIVEQRPDVRAAEEQLHFASAQAGVAVANRLPQFAVTGAIGGMADSPDWMFRTGGGFFNLAASVSQAIFDGGTLRAKSRAAEQALIQAGAQYRSTVTTALQNVADTLYTIQSDANALKAAAASTQAAQTTLDLTRRQYQLGYVNYQTQLAAEQNYLQSTINLAQAQSNRLGDTVALYQALGGGWWNRPNGHGKCDAPDDETCHARSPLPSSLPQTGERDKVSLREFHDTTASQKLEGGANAAAKRIDLDKTSATQQSATTRGESAQ
jgi:NodT family efflux transporter outer membrane factor (OMF) lipoprotein